MRLQVDYLMNGLVMLNDTEDLINIELDNRWAQQATLQRAVELHDLHMQWPLAVLISGVAQEVGRSIRFAASSF